MGRPLGEAMISISEIGLISPRILSATFPGAIPVPTKLPLTSILQETRTGSLSWQNGKFIKSPRHNLKNNHS